MCLKVNIDVKEKKKIFVQTRIQMRLHSKMNESRFVVGSLSSHLHTYALPVERIILHSVRNTYELLIEKKNPELKFSNRPNQYSCINVFIKYLKLFTFFCIYLCHLKKYIEPSESLHDQQFKFVISLHERNILVQTKSKSHAYIQTKFSLLFYIRSKYSFALDTSDNNI